MAFKSLSQFSDKNTPKKSIYEEISADDLRLCEEAFDLFDKDGDGTIDPNELKHLLRCFELPCDQASVDKYLREHRDPQSSGDDLTFKSIVEILRPSFKKQDLIEPEIQ